MPAKRDKVPCTPDERQDLFALVSTGKTAAYKLTRARMLLQADQGPEGPAWTDAHLCQALHVGRTTVARTREACVDSGFEAALQRRPRLRPGNQQFDGAQEAPLSALACAAPPAGRHRWTFPLLAGTRVAWHHFEDMSHETMRQHGKKTPGSLGCKSNGACHLRVMPHVSVAWKTALLSLIDLTLLRLRSSVWMNRVNNTSSRHGNR